MVKNTVAIIQARMGSTRLPEKVMKELSGKPIIWHIVERAKMAKYVDNVVVATSTNDTDTPLFNYLTSIGVTCIRGSEEDVLGRFYAAAVETDADVIVRLTGDNPLVDFKVLDETIHHFQQSGLAYVSSIDVPTIPKPIPLGTGSEVFSFEKLAEAYLHAREDFEREHVTPYMYGGKPSSSISEKYSFRLTVDTEEDFLCVSKIYAYLYHGIHNFCNTEICECLNSHPEILELNQNIHQKKLGE